MRIILIEMQMRDHGLLPNQFAGLAEAKGVIGRRDQALGPLAQSLTDGFLDSGACCASR